MGQFEKIVVLSVIGLIAVILVVSFSDTEPGLGEMPPAGGADQLAELHGPLPAGPRPIRGRSENLSDANQGHAPAPDEIDVRDPFQGEEAFVADGWEPRPQRGGDPSTEAIERDQLTLSTKVEDPNAPPAAPRSPETGLPAITDGLPAGSALIDLRGLESTWDAELMEYTCRSGDGLQKLARRYYGDATMEGLLRQFNEGVERLQEGQVLLIPVFDHRAPVQAVASPSVPSPAIAAAPVSGTAGTHVVGEGENLWGIAKDHYGRGTDWERIFEANLDQLSDKDSVRVGMTLRIP